MPNALPQRILLIDDDMDDCGIFKEAVCQVVPAVLICIHVPANLPSMIDDFKPDLVFTDLNISQTSGLDCIVEIKRRNTSIPVIIYSGAVSKSQADIAYEAGVDLIIQKPSSFEDLVNGLRMLFSVNWKEKNVVKQQFYGKVINLSVDKYRIAR